MEDFESIKSKILKLQALVEKGIDGEAANAKRVLENLLRKYGLTLEQVISEQEKKEKRKFEATREWHKKLLFQCYFYIMNKSKASYWGSGNKIWFELTDMEYAELSNLYEWHKAQLKKEIDKVIIDFSEAYCIKHNITNHSKDDDDTEDSKPLTAEEKRRIYRVLSLIESVEDTHYHKQIEHKL